MRRARIIVAILALSLLAPVAGASAAPPTDADIDAMMQTLETWVQENREGLDYEKYQAYIGELVADLDIAALSVKQIEKLESRGMLSASPEAQEKLDARLATLKADKGADGAAAAMMLFQMSYAKGPDAQAAALADALEHPGLADALQAGSGRSLFAYASRVEPEKLLALAPELLALEGILDAELSDETIAGLTGYVETLNAIDELLSTRREAIRAKLAEKALAAASKLDAQVEAGEDEDGSLAQKAKYLRSSADFLDGAYARGKLIGHQAPKLAFTWSSAETKPRSLADLKGKVVVLDFWATWCGPCIASFPNIRDLQERYRGYDVTIVGVTSLQGRHYPGDGPPVDTEGDPAKEYELMGTFMKAKDVTWPIAFSDKDVFNPDFGVRGIPHVAIIDAQGVVRYNGMHPSSPLAEKAKKIDKLLEEAGLPAPAPMAKVEE